MVDTCKSGGRRERRIRWLVHGIAVTGLGALVGCGAAAAPPSTGMGATAGAVAVPVPTVSAPTMKAPTSLTRPPSAPSSRPTTSAQGPATAHPAVGAAGSYVRALCPADWRRPYGDRERRAAAFLAPGAKRALAPTPPTRAAWNAEVVIPRLVVTCRVTAAQIVPAAPRSATRGYVAVLADRRAERPGTPPVLDQAEYVLKVALVTGRWLVEGALLAG